MVLPNTQAHQGASLASCIVGMNFIFASSSNFKFAAENICQEDLLEEILANTHVVLGMTSNGLLSRGSRVAICVEVSLCTKERLLQNNKIRSWRSFRFHSCGDGNIVEVELKTTTTTFCTRISTFDCCILFGWVASRVQTNKTDDLYNFIE